MEGIIYRRLYDEDGAIISLDGKILFKVPDVPRYRIPEGIEEIDIKAFKNRPHLKEIDIPYTVDWYTDYPMSNDAMRYAPKGLKVNYWNWPYPENCAVSEEQLEVIANGCRDEHGFVYSRDGKRLLRAAERVEEYWIPESVEHIERLAFIGCTFDTLHVPTSCSWEFKPEAEWPIFGSERVMGCIVFWERPYAEQDYIPDPLCVTEADHDRIIDGQHVMYTKNGKRLLCAREGFNAAEYYVPNGVITICDHAFLFCKQFLTLYLPSSVEVVGEELFGDAGGEIVWQ